MCRMLREPLSFTAAVIRDVLTNREWSEDVAQTAIEHALAHRSREEAEIAFAAELAVQFRDHYDVDSNCKFTEAVIHLALERTNWQAVARSILDRFAPEGELPLQRVVAAPSAN